MNNDKFRHFLRLAGDMPAFMAVYADQATGLPSWNAMLEYLPESVEWAKKTDGPLALSYIRFDRLAVYLRTHLGENNEEVRHQKEREYIGDLIKNSLPLIERHTEPDKDFIFRMDPEGVVSDLVSIIHKYRAVQEVAVIADSIKDEIAGTKIGRQGEILTVSIGVTGFDDCRSARRAENLMQEASNWLARAKETGNNVFYKGYKPPQRKE